MGDLFEKLKTKKVPYKASELKTNPTDTFTLPCLTCSFKNQGLNYYAPKDGLTILKNIISLPSDSDVYRAYYQPNDFTILNSSYALKWKYGEKNLTPNQYLFTVQCINKVTDLPIYSYKNKLGGWNVVKTKYIKLPIKNGKIDFDFMNRFVSKIKKEKILKLEKRFDENGLSDYQLTQQDKQTLENYTNLNWSTFNLENLFGKSTRGSRLKSADRVTGSIPFITAGETDEGVSAFIGNDVKVFSDNTTTIDMFGSAKYRNFKYGGDDHIAVVHTDKLPKYASVFVTSAIHKSSYNGQFNYGRNLYAKDADALDISLPVKDGKPDYGTMETVISAIHKLVIKDVVLYVEKKKKELNKLTENANAQSHTH